MITHSKEELYAQFKGAVDSYFQLQRDYDFLKAQRDRLQEEVNTLKSENIALKRLVEISK